MRICISASGIASAADRHGCTGTVRVGGLGSLTPLLSTTINDTTCVSAFGNTIAPGLGTELDSGVPSGKNHEYFCTEPSGSLAVPAKLTAWPAVMVTSPVGAVIRPFGGLMRRVLWHLDKACDRRHTSFIQDEEHVVPWRKMR